MSTPTPEELRRTVALALLDMTGILTPIYDTADGMRRDLESRGWSPTMAETAAGTWLCGVLASLGGGARQ
ncbi:hypothetical protein [Streptomyces sp. NPDC091259]|uniref:hypothetical protein n=1 Tax=Streptomyces sp. NPDC091259 TaxID=3365976 RepID=UPI0038257B4F